VRFVPTSQSGLVLAGWGVEVGNADSAQRGSGALGAGRDRTFYRAIAEIDVDHPYGLENCQRFGGREIEACGFELLLDGATEQEGEPATKM
jgi:hypothetical protein